MVNANFTPNFDNLPKAQLVTYLADRYRTPKNHWSKYSHFNLVTFCTDYKLANEISQQYVKKNRTVKKTNGNRLGQQKAKISYFEILKTCSEILNLDVKYINNIPAIIRRYQTEVKNLQVKNKELTSDIELIKENVRHLTMEIVGKCMQQNGSIQLEQVVQSLRDNDLI